VLVKFRAWHTSRRGFRIATRAHREFALLVELLAADRARHTVDDAALASAIRSVGAGHGASDALAVRLARLAPR